MKGVLIIGSLALLLAACNTAAEKNNEQSNGTPDSDKSGYAYTPLYSADFEMGDNKYGKMISRMWKDFDDNNLENSAGNFADSVVIKFQDTPEMLIHRDSLLASTKVFRNSFDSVWSSVDAITTMKEKKHGLTHVIVWGTEYHKDGAEIDSMAIHEIWNINKDGKIVYYRQFADKVF